MLGVRRFRWRERSFNTVSSSNVFADFNLNTSAGNLIDQVEQADARLLVDIFLAAVAADSRWHATDDKGGLVAFKRDGGVSWLRVTNPADGASHRFLLKVSSHRDGSGS